MGFLSNIGNAVGSVFSEVGDAVETVVDTVVDIVEDAVDAVVEGVQTAINVTTEWISDNTADWIGGVFGFFGGLADGLLQGVRDILGGVFEIVRQVVNIVGDILRLDFAAVARDLVNLLIAIGGLILRVVRFVIGGYLVGGVVGFFERNALRKFVKQLIETKYENDPERLDRIKKKLGMSSGNWGLFIIAVHKRFMLDSQNTPLWDWHNRGIIDLYRLAGLLSFDSFVAARPRTLVKVVGDDGKDNTIAVNRYVISKYIESQGIDYRLRVYATEDEALSDILQTARDKCRKLGLKLYWNNEARFPQFNTYDNHEIFTEGEYNLDPESFDGYLVTKGLKVNGDDCTLLALCAFSYTINTKNGQTAGRNITKGDGANDCIVPDRTDHCCNLVITNKEKGSGVTYRDRWPSYITKYALPHEIGHYFGLCHYGHHGFQNIMYTKGEADAGSWKLFKYYYIAEPEFTLDDGKNAWRFIVNQLDKCL